MSHQIIASELLNELSNKQQKVLVGGADFELSGSNFGNRRSGLIGKTSSVPQGSSASSASTSTARRKSRIQKSRIQKYYGIGFLGILNGCFISAVAY